MKYDGLNEKVHFKDAEISRSGPELALQQSNN